MSAKVGDLTRGGREEELREELCESREKVERAKVAREQLRELYMERNRGKVGTGREASKEEFTRLKEEYFRSVVEAGKLEEKMGELKQEVVEANKSVNRLQKELQMTTGGEGQGSQGAAEGALRREEQEEGWDWQGGKQGGVYQVKGGILQVCGGGW